MDAGGDNDAGSSAPNPPSPHFATPHPRRNQRPRRSNKHRPLLSPSQKLMPGKRAISLEDLTRQARATATPSRLPRRRALAPMMTPSPAKGGGGDGVGAVERGERAEDGVNRAQDDPQLLDYSEDEDKLALRERESKVRIYSAVLLGCWRRRRSEYFALSASVVQWRTEAQSLGMQSEVLRQLLEAERARVASAVEEARAAAADALAFKEQLERMQQEAAHAEKRVAEAEARAAAAEEQAEEADVRAVAAETTMMNVRNDYVTACAEARDFENALERERGKIKTMRAEQSKMQEKLLLTMEQLAVTESQVEHLQTTIADLRASLDEMEMLDATVESAKLMVATLELELSSQQKELEKVLEERRKQQGELENMHKELKKREAQRAALEALVDMQRQEIEALKEELSSSRWQEQLARVFRIFSSLPFTLMERFAVIFVPPPP